MKKIEENMTEIEIIVLLAALEEEKTKYDYIIEKDKSNAITKRFAKTNESLIEKFQKYVEE